MTSKSDHNICSLRIDRRQVLAIGGSVLAAPFAGGAFAFGSEVHKTTIGQIELTIVSDGHLTFPKSMIAVNVSADDIDTFLLENMGSIPETVSPETNHALIRTGDELVLVDNGSGSNFQPTAGKLQANLRLNGIDPATITKVIFTHAHGDHVWGTVLDDSSLMLPNAEYFIGEAEYNFWMNPDVFSMIPKEFHPFAKLAQFHLGAVKDRTTMVKDGDTIASGVRIIETPGHTPGHISVMVENGGSRLVVIGDVAVNEKYSLQHPDWHFGADSIPELAVQTRRDLLGMSASEEFRVLGYHFSYPGLGIVEREGDVFRFASTG